MSTLLSGVRVVELSSIGPGPFAAMLLGDLGAEVLRIDRPGGIADPQPMLRNRSGRVEIDLKDRDGVELALGALESADVLIEGLRPGVMERLGLGPEACLELNPGLVYARVTGWGQEGPRAFDAGHDIGYLALTGVLHALGDPDSEPVPPLNLVADFGGGGMLLVVGILAALIERSRTGRGRVVDAAMVDGVTLLATMIHDWAALGAWSEQRGSNLLDGGAPYYRCYRTADDRFMAVGALEPQFYARLLEGLGLDAGDLPAQNDRSHWPELTERFAAVFATRTRDEWADRFAGVDACVVPVLTFTEAAQDPHLRARSTLAMGPEGPVPATAPRFPGMEAPAAAPLSAAGIYERLGISSERAAALQASGTLGAVTG